MIFLSSTSSIQAWLRLAFNDFTVSQGQTSGDNGFLYETTQSS